MVIFALLWLPIHLVLLYAHCYGPPAEADLFNAIFLVCTGLSYFNSCVNPIIYNRTSKDFRDAFRSAVGCQKRAAVDGGDAATMPLHNLRATAACQRPDDGPKLAVEDAQCADGKIQVEN